MQDLDEGWQSFVRAFNSGRFYEAHEAAELIWASRGYPPRDVFRGLTQLAVALAHVQKGNVIGAARVLKKAHSILMVARSPTWIAQSIHKTESLLLAADPAAALMLMGPTMPEAFDSSFLRQGSRPGEV